MRGQAVRLVDLSLRLGSVSRGLVHVGECVVARSSKPALMRSKPGLGQLSLRLVAVGGT